jgi:hypothetical protein
MMSAMAAMHIRPPMTPTALLKGSRVSSFGGGGGLGGGGELI